MHSFYSVSLLTTSFIAPSDSTDNRISPQKIPHFQRSASGIAYLSQLWYAGMNVAPDMVCALRHTFVKVRADGSAVVRCCFALKGTQVAELDRNKQEDVARIARYQAYKAAGRRDITITEAAVAAVAPDSMVMLRSNSNLSAAGNNSEGTTPAGSPRSAQAQDEPGDSATVEDNSAQDRIVAEDTGLGHSVTTTKRPTSGGEAATRSEGVRSSAPLASPKGSADSEHSATKGDINWLAMADYAYNAGTLEQCMPRSQKKYYYSGAVGDDVVDGGASNGEHDGVDVDSGIQVEDHSEGADKSAVTDGMVSSDVHSSAAVIESAALSNAVDTVLAQQLRRTVITASVDCICGIEFEFSPEGTITSVVLHYFR
jgi:hypothetical protein